MWRNDNTNMTSNPWQMLADANERNGYDVPSTCCIATNNISGDLSTVEENYFKFGRQNRDSHYDNSPYSYVLAAAAKFHNISKSKHHKKPSLVSLRISMYQLPAEFTKLKVLVITTEGSSLMYCRTANVKKKTDILSALHSPFDRSTWILMLLAFVTICVIPGLPIWRCTDLIWSILGQPPQAKQFGLLIVALSIVLIPIQSSYTNYFTSNAVKPFEEPFIDGNLELFDSGFKYLCEVFDNATICAEANPEHETPFKKLDLDLKAMEQYFLIIPEEPGAEFHTVLSKARDKGTWDIDRKFYNKVKFLSEQNIPSTQCHMLSEYWTE